MNKYLLIFFLSLTLLCSCSDDNAPADANENFITSVILTVGNDSYEAVINDGTITITVPYTVSLDGAIASFAYTPSAKIYPNPQEITDWNEERIFRVVSYNGDERQYTYTVIKDEIREDGDVVLKNAADIAAFAEKGVSVINGNLTIGTNDGEDIANLSGLENLKEITGSITILNSFKGTDLTGLENLTKVGGMNIGSEDAFSTSPIYFFSLNSLEEVTGDINIYNNSVEFVDFKDLPSIMGSVNIASAKLKSITAEQLTAIFGDFVVSCKNGNATGGEIKEFTLPAITNIGGKLSGEGFAELTAIYFPALKEVGEIRFETLPIDLSKISFPEIETVNGDVVFTSQTVYHAIGSSTSGNSTLLTIDGFDKLKTIKGILKLVYFTEVTSIPNISNASIGGAYFECLNQINTLNLSNTEFISDGDKKATITIVKMPINEIIGHEIMNCNFSLGISNTWETKKLPELTNISETGDIHFLSHSALPSSVTLAFNIRKINGCFHLDTKSQVCDITLSMPNLTDVTDYIFINGEPVNWNIQLPKLETIGGQLRIRGYMEDFNFSSLKNVCVGNTSTELKYQNFINDDNGFQKGFGMNLGLMKDGVINFPLLEKIGGNGMRVDICFFGSEFSCPNLKAINNQLILTSEGWSNNSLNIMNIPQLNTVDNIQISNFGNLVDFSSFATVFTNGQISQASNWSVSGCGYNPTFDDMKAGRYKSTNSVMQTVSKKSPKSGFPVRR